MLQEMGVRMNNLILVQGNNFVHVPIHPQVATIVYNSLYQVAHCK